MIQRTIKERTTEYRQGGPAPEETRQIFKVSGLTIQKWEKHLKETEALVKKELHRGFRKIDPEKRKAYAAGHSDAYRSEPAEASRCSESGIQGALRRCRITEKKTIRYREQDRQKAAVYQEAIRDIPPETIAYVNECGIDTYLYRKYGYAPCGRQISGRISGRTYKRCGPAASKTADKIPAPLQYSGIMDSRLLKHGFPGSFCRPLTKAP